MSQIYPTISKNSIKRKSPGNSRKNYPEVFNTFTCISYSTTIHGRLTSIYSKSSSSKRSACSNAAICNLFVFIVNLFIRYYLFVFLFIIGFLFIRLFYLSRTSEVKIEFSPIQRVFLFI